MRRSCPHCQAKVAPETRFCPQCGAVLTEPTRPGGRVSPASAQRQTGREQARSPDVDAFFKRRVIGLGVNFIGMLLLLLLLIVLVFLLPPLRCPLGLAILLGALIASMNYAKLRRSLRQLNGGLRQLFF